MPWFGAWPRAKADRSATAGAGRPGPPRFAGWKSWIRLVARIPTLRSRAGRAQWLWIAGNRLGQIRGSVRFRTIML